MLDLYRDFCTKYPMVTIEDPFEQVGARCSAHAENKRCGDGFMQGQTFVETSLHRNRPTRRQGHAQTVVTVTEHSMAQFKM